MMIGTNNSKPRKSITKKPPRGGGSRSAPRHVGFLGGEFLPVNHDRIQLFRMSQAVATYQPKSHEGSGENMHMSATSTLLNLVGHREAGKRQKTAATDRRRARPSDKPGKLKYGHCCNSVLVLLSRKRQNKGLTAANFLCPAPASCHRSRSPAQINCCQLRRSAPAPAGAVPDDRFDHASWLPQWREAERIVFSSPGWTGAPAMPNAVRSGPGRDQRRPAPSCTRVRMAAASAVGDLPVQNENIRLGRIRGKTHSLSNPRAVRTPHPGRT